MSSNEAIETTANNVVEHNGYVAFFDILGYQSFLEAHPIPTTATREVIQTINSIKSIVPQQVQELISGNEVKDILDSFGWLVFSDTILVTVSQEPNDSAEAKTKDLLVLAAVASELQRFMLDYGLPVRGAITYGRFMFAEACMAGLPIVKAYKLSGQLNLAACVVDKEVINGEPEYTSSPSGDVVSLTQSKMGATYRIPLRDNKEDDFYIVMPSTFLVAGRSSWHDADIKQLVTDSFWKHGKQISIAAQPKVANTELFLRYVKMKREEYGVTFQ